MPLTLALKLFLVPSLIYMVTLAGRRWGPGVAGWISAFPVVAGPILLTVALEQGNAFAASAAQGTLMAVIAVVVFCVAYAWASGAFGVAGTLGCAFAAYAAAVAALNMTSMPPTWSFLAVLGTLSIAPRLFPRVAAPALTSKPSRDMLWRMVSAAALVLLVTFGAARLGPKLSGIFAMFPVMGSVLTSFTHAQQGRAHAVALLRGMILGYVGFAAFCLVVALLLRQASIGLAFTAAFGCALVVQAGVKTWLSTLPGREAPANAQDVKTGSRASRRRLPGPTEPG
jgi:hypothetical protein